MPISKKIIEQINMLDIGTPEKDLLIKLLNFEDQGLPRYKNTYKSEIKEYLKQKECEGN